MEIIISNEQGMTLVNVAGRIDTANSAEFNNQLVPLMQSDLENVVLDCSELSYISSSGLRSFLSLQKAVQAKKGHLVIRNMRPEIKKIFDITGFSKIFIFE